MISYIDRDGNPLPDDWLPGYPQWLRDAVARERDWYPTDRRVGSTQIGDVRVSTIWGGLDCGGGRIFETQIFGGPHDLDRCMYVTEEQAMRGHLATVDNLRAGKEPWASR